MRLLPGGGARTRSLRPGWDQATGVRINVEAENEQTGWPVDGAPAMETGGVTAAETSGEDLAGEGAPSGEAAQPEEKK